jgi:ADP-ribose pyrophosphatase
MPEASAELRRLSHKLLYSGRIIDLYVDEAEYPSGKPTVREVVHHPGGAATVPLTDEGHVILVDQLRYPLGRHILEIPAGKLSPGENPAHCAARELEEETGWIAGSLTKLCAFHTSPGFCDELLHIFLARELRLSPDGHKREEGEFSMSLRVLPFGEGLAMIESGEITDAKTMIGLMLVASRFPK